MTAQRSHARAQEPAARDAHALRLASRARRRDVVVIAASAGGVLPLLDIVASLPADFSTPIAIVLHRTSKPPRLLDKLLARRCALRVVEASTGDALVPGTIFVAPPDGHLRIQSDRTLAVEDGRRIDHVRSSANPLFESAAELFGPNVVAVVLSGSGRNGARGVAAIKERGGTVLVQNQSTSQYFEMPAAAIQTGAVDFVLPADEIGEALEILCAAPDSTAAALVAEHD
jgi:two-component system, chemotaxis family, protein-glutamate methylesterase/glutaminase